jgi:hypothetical protein
MVLSLFGYVDRSNHLRTYCLDRSMESTFESPMRRSLDLFTDCGVWIGDNLDL